MAVTWEKIAFESKTILKSLLTEQGDIIYASASSTPAALPHGDAGDVLTSGGHGANPSWTAPSGGSVDYQLFESSGTWTKPAGCTMVLIDVVGGGAGGSAASSFGGGGGGARLTRTLPASLLGSTETITVGATAAGAIITGYGTNGNYSSFGTWVVAQGGKSGATPTGGCVGTANVSQAVTNLIYMGGGVPHSSGAVGGSEYAGGNATANLKGSPSVFGGGGGGQGTYSTGYAGGGVGAFNATGGTGGTSGGGNGGNGADGNLSFCGKGGGGGGGGGYGVTGGNGGNGGTPGGGGGGGGSGSVANGNGGTGARGEVRVWAW